MGQGGEDNYFWLILFDFWIVFFGDSFCLRTLFVSVCVVRWGRCLEAPPSSLLVPEILILRLSPPLFFVRSTGLKIGIYSVVVRIGIGLK